MPVTFCSRARLYATKELQPNPRMTDKDPKKAQLRHLANEAFPAAAKAGGYPIVFNHCFLRVVYDHVFQDKWQRQLQKGKAAIHQLSEEQLDRAIETGRQMVEDKDLAIRLNRQSLRYRGKL